MWICRLWWLVLMRILTSRLWCISLLYMLVRGEDSKLHRLFGRLYIPTQILLDGSRAIAITVCFLA